MTIAGGIWAALFHRERTGEATMVDVSLIGTGMWAMGAGIALSQLGGHAVARVRQCHRRCDRAIPLIGTYRTTDDRFLSFCMLQGYHYWPEACDALRHPQDLIDDPRFATNERLIENTPCGGRDRRRRVRSSATLEEWRERFAG